MALSDEVEALAARIAAEIMLRVPSDGAPGQVLTWQVDGTKEWQAVPVQVLALAVGAAVPEGTPSGTFIARI